MSYTPDTYGDFKQSAVATTTGNITLSSLGTQGGGDWASPLAAGDRVLVKNQTTGSQNGIYNASASGWTRSRDADQGLELTGGTMITVEEGATLSDTTWIITNDGTVTIGATSLAFAQVGGGPPTGSAGGDLTGTYPNPTVGALKITDAKVATANKDGASGTPSMRTLGTGALQACAGNDSRLTPTGRTVITAVADGSTISLPTTIAANSSVSLASTYTNTSGVTVYAKFRVGGRYETEPVATGLQERLISMMLRVQSGGSTTGTVLTTGGAGTESFTDMSRVTLASTTIHTRHRITSEILFELTNGQIADVDVLTRCLENLVGWRGSVGSGGQFQAVDGYWEISEKK